MTRATTLASCAPGDIVELWAGLAAQTCKVTQVNAGLVWLRSVDPVTYEEQWQEPRESPLMLRPETVCTLVVCGAERWPRQHGGASDVDPLQIRSAS